MESQKTRQPDQKERKRDVMYNPKSLKAEEFISDEEIRETLAYADANKDNIELIDQILAKAKECKGLTHRDPLKHLQPVHKTCSKNIFIRS